MRRGAAAAGRSAGTVVGCLGAALVELTIACFFVGTALGVMIAAADGLRPVDPGCVASSPRSQLQTIRAQTELYRVQHGGVWPDWAGNGWSDLVEGGYLIQAPRNPLVTDPATGEPSVRLCTGPLTVGDATTIGCAYYWSTTDGRLYVVWRDGRIGDW